MVITVTSLQGGAAKTTTAVHLADCLQRAAAPTLLLDQSRHRTATSWIQRGAFPFTAVDNPDLLTANYRHCVIDADHPRDLSQRLISRSDLILVTTTPQLLSPEAATKIAKEIARFTPGRVRVLLTIVPAARRPLQIANPRGLLTQSGLPVLNTEIREHISHQVAACEGVPVYRLQHTQSAAAWANYRQLATEILTGFSRRLFPPPGH